MLKQILVGLFVSLLGGVLMYFSQSINESFGRVDWFERHLGSTKTGYVLVGFVIVVVGFLILFGVLPLGSGVTQTAVQ